MWSSDDLLIFGRGPLGCDVSTPTDEGSSTVDQNKEFGFDLNSCILHLLHRAQQAADEAFAAAFADTGLTPRQLAVLVIVAEREGTNQVGLVEATGIDRSTTADLVRRLMRKGLLARRRARHDARSNVLRLTEEGKGMLASFRVRAAEVDQMLLNSLPEASRSSFVDALGRIAAINPGTSQNQDRNLLAAE
jgi:DNA-binding MarR family transcriptional regulator